MLYVTRSLSVSTPRIENSCRRPTYTVLVVIDVVGGGVTVLFDHMSAAFSHADPYVQLTLSTSKSRSQLVR